MQFRCLSCSGLYPNWPKDFRWSHNGPLTGHKCIKIDEPDQDPKDSWDDNYFCWKQKPGQTDPGIRWSHTGKKMRMYFEVKDVTS